MGWPVMATRSRASPALPERLHRYPFGVGDTSTSLGDHSRTEPLRRTALIDAHQRLGAKLVGFGGWEMPLSYGEGTLGEHRACRHDAVVFDVSHLGTVRIQGADAFDRLQAALSNDLRRIGPGRAQYTHLLDNDDGSVVDDIIVWWLSDDVFDVMPNASNTRRVEEAIGGKDTTDSRCVIALQGPHARARLATIAPDASSVPRFGVAPFVWEGVPCVVAGTGYTGEDGVECAVPADAADALWTALLAAGAQPAGLGARDTLRLEAALPLHGHELGPGITPLQAGMGWVVGWDKAEFRGRAALLDERERGVARRLVGMATADRQPPRQTSAVVKDGRAAGTITSGNFSPMLGHGIALALVDTSFDPEPSMVFDIEQRGRLVPATVVSTPFTRAGQWASGG
jgi:aminomethyltransferase